MSYLTITKLKGHASIQDLGRPSAQHLGFSASGAADEYSYLLANQLLNNASSAPTLEVTLGQLSLTATDTCHMVITGADCQAFIVNEQKKPLNVPNNQVFTLTKGNELHLFMPKKQLHSYIAIAGGFLSKRWLNSASQTASEYALGFGEKKLAIGQNLCFSTVEQSKTYPLTSQPSHYFHQDEQLALRFLPSGFWHNITVNKQQQLLAQKYQITPKSNRMGYRLSGKPLHLHDNSSLLSKPVNYGAIQLPDDGQIIILMKERQTIGGYPVLGTVIQTDLFRLSQKRPGEYVNFVAVTLEQAQAQLLAFKTKFAS
mgnify:CR=1 FL=1